jgi:hypothetical protein
VLDDGIKIVKLGPTDPARMRGIGDNRGWVAGTPVGKSRNRSRSRLTAAITSSTEEP